jgi:phosphoesterase RecJ-like protein
MAPSTEILKALKKSKRILIPLHRNPDGDSAGSALALKHLLNDLGKQAEVVSVDPLPRNLRFLPGAEEIKQTDLFDLDLSRYDLIAFVDANSPARFTHKENPKIPKGVKVVCIDHHPPQADTFPTLSHIRPKASSAAEVLLDLIREWKIKIAPEIAQCLLAGIATDTNRFQHIIPPEVLEKAARLMREGADLTKVLSGVYRSWPSSVLTLWAAIFRNTSIKDKVAYAILRKNELEEISMEKDIFPTARAYAVTELLSSFDNTKAAALFTEEQSRIHINLRSWGKLDVGKVAEKLGGGGHERSAAANPQCTLEEAVDKTLKLLSNG